MEHRTFGKIILRCIIYFLALWALIIMGKGLCYLFGSAIHAMKEDFTLIVAIATSPESIKDGTVSAIIAAPLVYILVEMGKEIYRKIKEWQAGRKKRE